METPPPPTNSSAASRGERDPDDEIICLESCLDPTPRPSSMTVREFIDRCVACAERQFSLHPPRSPSRKERNRIWLEQEENRKVLLLALQTYAKQNNVQHNELELVELKERNRFFDSCALEPEYEHFNFVVKGPDGMLRLFFAEVLDDDCTEEQHVHLCTPVEDTDSGVCFGCKSPWKEIIHPTSGGYLGGVHKEVGYLAQMDSDDDGDYM